MCFTRANTQRAQQGAPEHRLHGADVSDSQPDFVVGQVISNADARPEACAVSTGTTVITYRELDRRSAVLAHLLKTLNVGPDVVVGLCLPRCPAMIVGALGILRAGGAYLPIDPSDPERRLAALIQDAGVEILVTAPHSGLDSLAVGRETIVLDHCGQIMDSGPRGARTVLSAATSKENGVHEIFNTVKHTGVAAVNNVGALSSNLAYVIYTSGSTGQPKGVEITRASLANLILWHQQALKVTA